MWDLYTIRDLNKQASEKEEGIEAEIRKTMKSIQTTCNELKNEMAKITNLIEKSNSYITCGCGEKAYRNKNDQYICPSCKKEVKSGRKGWE